MKLFLLRYYFLTFNTFTMSFISPFPKVGILIMFTLCWSACQQKRATSLIESVVSTETINPQASKIIKLSCPSGKQMVGGGYTVSPNDADFKVNIRGSFPSDLHTWEVDLFNPSTKSGSVTVYVYYYTGNKALGMHIVEAPTVITAPPAAGFAYIYSNSTVVTTEPSDVVTSGGFQIDPGNAPMEINTLGSFPLFGLPTGIPGPATGWKNNISIMAGKTGTITSYAMCSRGTVLARISQPTPIFDAGPVLMKKSTDIIPSSLPSYELEVNDGFFCTGGGYDLEISSSAGNFFVPTVYQNNATTHTGVNFGWEFAGSYLNNQSPWDIYALQLKFH
jgi:hypothetical protein